jgi:beta-glucanase (GH16 family)
MYPPPRVTGGPAPRRPVTHWRALGLASAGLLAIALVAVSATARHEPPSDEGSTLGTPSPTFGATPTTIASATASPRVTLPGYTFDDEFDGTTIDPIWTHDFGFSGAENVWANSQSSVADGVLTISAQRTGFGWASDVLDTKTTWTQQYGYFEARMKIPKGAGLWPAFWLYASQHGIQPEIDVMEVCASPLGENDGNDASLLHSTLHWARGGQRTARVRTVDLSLDFHVYAVDWRADHIAFLLDGVEVARFSDPDHIPTTPMPLILDLAVGGPLCGPSTDLTPNPSLLQVDWVRARS